VPGSKVRKQSRRILFIDCTAEHMGQASAPHVTAINARRRM
jgi:hypothetical protein